MVLDDGLDDGQPQPRPTVLSVASVVAAEEAVEHLRQVLRSDALAAVAHNDLGRAVAAADAHQDIAAGRRVAQRIGQQVLHRLANAVGVHIDHRRRAQQFHAQGDALGRRQRRKARRAVLYQPPQVGRLPVERQLARLGQSQLVQVAHQPRQVVGLVEQTRHLGLVEGVDAVEDGLQVAAQDVERIAQFVGHVGQQLPPQRLGLLQLPGHVVERLRHSPQLPAAAHPHPVGQIAGGNGLRAARQLLQRGQQRPTEHHAGQRAGHGGHDQGAAEKEADGRLYFGAQLLALLGRQSAHQRLQLAAQLRRHLELDGRNERQDHRQHQDAADDQGEAHPQAIHSAASANR